jgi:hypothetical protein
VAKWKFIKELAKCKLCGKSLKDKPQKQKYCSIKCCNSDKAGTQRKDCRVYFECSCGKRGFGISFWNRARKMCRDCAAVVPKKKPKGGHKNRVYKTCVCGFVGYGQNEFPHQAKGLCCKCWSSKTGKIKVNDTWDSWANAEGSSLYRKQRRIVSRHGSPWDSWATRKRSALVYRKRIAKGRCRGNLQVIDWDDCVRFGIYKLNQQFKHARIDSWDRKCYSWMRSLKLRIRVQAGDKSAS